MINLIEYIHMLSVNEIFYTIQGEGPTVGKPSIFLRLSGCNLRCYWCDTSYTWLYSNTTAENIREKLVKRFGDDMKSISLNVYNQKDETHPMELDKIEEEFLKFQGKHVVITGGEPLLQKDALVILIEMLNQKGYSFEIETNGTISPGGLPDVRFNVSPKLDNSLNDHDKRYKPEILDEFLERDAIFKFVITTQKDMKEVEQIIGSIDIPKDRVYLMPEGRSTEELREKSGWLIDVCKTRNYNYTHRLHIDLFDKSRGV